LAPADYFFFLSMETFHGTFSNSPEPSTQIRKM